MRKLLAILASLLASAGISYSMDIRGSFIMDTRFSLSNADLLFNQENGSLQFEQQVNDNLYGKAKIGFKYYNNPIGKTTFNNILSADELGMIYSVQPFEISLDEAYFTYSDFLINKLDLSAGKQRIAWGSADKLNPTDLLNPNDFSDPFDFGKKIPTSAVNMTYHFPFMEGGLQMVYEPFSAIARMNTLMEQTLKDKMLTNLVENQSARVSGINYPSLLWDEAVETPSLNASNFTYGVKLFAVLAGMDLSISYITRINDFPAAKTLNINQRTDMDGTFSTTNITLEQISYNLVYYREHVIGSDFSKDLNFLLLWGEASLTFPGEQKTLSKISNDIYITGLGYAGSTNIIEDSVSLSNEVYVKYTLGMDKSFDGGWYANFQYNHGFFNERGNNGPERLQDYFLLRVEEKVFSEQLKFALTGLYNINNLWFAFQSSDLLNYLSKNSGILGQFGITYTPKPDLNIEIGVILIDGKEGTTLGTMKNSDSVYAKFEFNF
jgi:hypothetical protein